MYLEPALNARMFIRVSTKNESVPESFPEKRGRIDRVNYPSINCGGQLIAHPPYSNLLRVHNYANISFGSLFRVSLLCPAASWVSVIAQADFFRFVYRITDFYRSPARFVQEMPVLSQLMSNRGQQDRSELLVCLRLLFTSTWLPDTSAIHP